MCRGTLTRSATLPSPGVPASRRIAALVVSLAVALAPATAFAQNGAGDEQYTDPFAGGSQQPATKPKPKPQPTPVKPVPHQQVQSSQPSAQQSASSSQQAAPSAAQPAQLPRTGFDVIPVALVGVALVAAGLLLRRRAADDRD
jgi:LPXTG-motif cell wall-anchored protein